MIYICTLYDIVHDIYIYIYYMTLYDISDIYVDSSLISDISDVSVRGDPKASHASAERREAGGGNCFFQGTSGFSADELSLELHCYDRILGL